MIYNRNIPFLSETLDLFRYKAVKCDKGACNRTREYARRLLVDIINYNYYLYW